VRTSLKKVESSRPYQTFFQERDVWLQQWNQKNNLGLKGRCQESRVCWFDVLCKIEESNYLKVNIPVQRGLVIQENFQRFGNASTWLQQKRVYFKNRVNLQSSFVQLFKIFKVTWCTSAQLYEECVGFKMAYKLQGVHMPVSISHNLEANKLRQRSWFHLMNIVQTMMLYLQ
jgi:hypothetical protein